MSDASGLGLKTQLKAAMDDGPAGNGKEHTNSGTSSTSGQDRVLQAFQRATREGDISRLSLENPTLEELHRMQVLLSDTEGQECLPCAMCHNSTPYSLLNNGHPIIDGDVCSSCWAHHVVPARLQLTAQWARRQRNQQGRQDRQDRRASGTHGEGADEDHVAGTSELNEAPPEP